MILLCFIQITVMSHIMQSQATDVVMLWLVIGQPPCRRATHPHHRSSLPAASHARHNQKQKTWRGGRSTVGIWGFSFRLSSQQSFWRGGRDTESRGSASWNPTSVREVKRGLTDRSEVGSGGVWVSYWQRLTSTSISYLSTVPTCYVAISLKLQRIVFKFGVFLPDEKFTIKKEKIREFHFHFEEICINRQKSRRVPQTWALGGAVPTWNVVWRWLCECSRSPRCLCRCKPLCCSPGSWISPQMGSRF